MKRCQVCGAQMRVDAELVEGQRQYHWYKCTNLKCGAVFLVQERTGRPAEFLPHQAAETPTV